MGLGTERGPVSQMTLHLIRPGLEGGWAGRSFLDRDRTGRVFIKATWWAMAPDGGHWRVSRHTLALPGKGGGPFSQSLRHLCIRGIIGGILLLITVTIVIILLFLLNVPLLTSGGQNKYLSPQTPYSREGLTLMLCESVRNQ